MSRQLKISLWGLYRINPNLFNGFVVPEEIDKENLVNRILMDTMDLDTIYSDPEDMQTMISIWSASHLDSWEKIAKALAVEYEPLDNYERIEDRTDTGESHTGSTRTDNLANHNTQTNRRSAFNGDTLSVTDQIDNDGTDTGTQEIVSNNHGNVHRDSHIHGINNAKRSELLADEIRVRLENELDCIIADQFKLQFINLVY